MHKVNFLQNITDPLTYDMGTHTIITLTVSDESRDGGSQITAAFADLRQCSQGPEECSKYS